MEHLRVVTGTWQPPLTDPTAPPAWSMLGEAAVWKAERYKALRAALMKEPLAISVSHSTSVTTLSAQVGPVAHETSVSVFDAREAPAGLPMDLQDVKVWCMVVAARGQGGFLPPTVPWLVKRGVPLLLFGEELDVTHDAMTVKKAAPACKEHSFAHYVRPQTAHPLMTNTMLDKAVRVLYTNPAQIRVQVSPPALPCRSCGCPLLPKVPACVL